MIKKPPLGCVPRYIAYQDRMKDLLDAINKCIQQDYKIQLKWVREYNALLGLIELENKEDEQ